MSKFTAAEVLKNRDVMRDPMSAEAKRYDLLTAFAEMLAEREGNTCEDEGCPHYGTPHSHAAPSSGGQAEPVAEAIAQQDMATEIEHLRKQLKASQAECATQTQEAHRYYELVLEAEEKVLAKLSWPEEPTEAMWNGLARDIIFWQDTLGNEPPTPRTLFDFLDNTGTEIPQWLRDEPECKNLDHAISRGTRVVIIYRAMRAAHEKEGQ